MGGDDGVVDDDDSELAKPSAGVAVVVAVAQLAFKNFISNAHRTLSPSRDTDSGSLMRTRVEMPILLSRRKQTRPRKGASRSMLVSAAGPCDLALS